MCLLALFYHQIEGVPILLAANREEDYARPATGPMLLDGVPRVVCGLDRLAGGTWLGLSQYALVAAITNRPKHGQPADRRSRGLLCSDLLRCVSAEQAAATAARELASGRYDGCNALCVDLRSAYVVHGGDTLEELPLEPDIHVVTAGDVDDAGCPRVVHAREQLARWEQDGNAPAVAASLSPIGRTRHWLEAAAQLCREHGGHGTPAICLHNEQHGTVSSSLIALPESSDQVIYRHAPGPPCRTPYEDYSDLARQCLQSE
jgi:hypothetical protein